MSAITVMPPFPIFNDASGVPLQSGYVYVGVAGMNAESNPIPVFWDSALTIPAVQPLRTSGGYVSRNGSPAQIYANAVDCSLLVKNKSMALVWSSLYVSGIKADSSGVIFLQSGTGAVPTTVQSKLREIVSVKDFGAVGDGVNDDTSAIQLAVNSLVTTGGAVIFPDGRYKVTAQINVQSKNPIHLLGNMGGQLYNPAQNPYGIVIGGNIAGSIIRYAAPASRAEHGGGQIKGLAFYDATGSGATPGTYSCTAAVEIHDFAQSSIEDCYFSWINGSAIKGEFTVMSTIKGNHIRYCGAVGKPAINLPSTSATYPAQSTDINGNRAEVCHGAPYLVLGANSADCKVRANGFETDTAVASANQQFAQIGGVAHQVIGNHFNRTTETQITLSGQNCTVVGNSFRGDAYTTTSVVVTGSRNAITGNSFQSTRTAYEVDITGPYNLFSSNVMYSSGAVRVASTGNTVTNNLLNFCTALTANLGAGNDWWIQDSAGAIGSVISGNTLSNFGGGVTTTGGIRVLGTTPAASNNSFNGFNGGGNGGVCIRLETSNAVVGGNIEVNSTALISTSGVGSSELYGNFPVSGGVNLPLTGVKSYDPPSIASGGVNITFIEVTGAAFGDYVLLSFSESLQGVSLTGYVTSAGFVEAVFQNNTGVAVNIAAGTLKARVLKR